MIILKKHIVKTRVNALEKEIISRKADAANLSISEFIRRSTLNLKIKNALTAEEIECYKNLSKYGDNFRRISNLFKAGDVSGMKKETLETSRLIRKHLENFKK